MRRGEPSRRAVVVDQVDHAPVRQIAHGELGDPPERRLVVRRGGKDLARAREDVELPLAVESLGRGGALGGEQALPLLAGVPALAHVEQVALDVERPAVVVAHRHRFVVHPNDPAVSREHPVLAAQRSGARGRGRDLGRDALAVVLVHELEEQVGLGEPFVGRIAEDHTDLRTDVQRRLALAQRVQVGDRRQMLGEGPVFRFALPLAGFGPLGLSDVAGDDHGARRLAGGVRDRRHGHRDRELDPVRAGMDDAGNVEALADLRGDGGAHRLLGEGVGRQERDRLADRRVGRVAVDRFGTCVPAHDRPVEVDADDRLGGGVPYRRELAGDDALLERRAAPGHRQPAGKAADGEPGREPD